MRRSAALLIAAGTALLALTTAGPALAVTGDTQECSPGTNGGTLTNGVCVLPALNVGQNAEEFLLNTGGVDVWTIVSGAIPTGMQMPTTYGAGATIIGGIPTTAGTFTFTVDNVPYTGPSDTPSQLSYSITVNGALPLAVVLPAGGSALHQGTVGVPYAQNFFASGGVAPYTWNVVTGQLPGGLSLVSTAAPRDNGNQLAGTPTKAGQFAFTMQVTDGAGHQATQQFTLKIGR
ncbi:MAG: putative Ig domain-containing protein [Promicromonosporaceae bacterium]|nr:putative Ig domain-containing protein [Promicromonosporaceae bacterium]